MRFATQVNLASDLRITYKPATNLNLHTLPSGSIYVYSYTEREEVNDQIDRILKLCERSKVKTEEV